MKRLGRQEQLLKGKGEEESKGRRSEIRGY